MALRRDGPLKLHQPLFKNDLRPIDENCECSTCKHYTRAYLNHVVRFEPVGASLVTVHNVAFQVNQIILLHLLNKLMHFRIVSVAFDERRAGEYNAGPFSGIRNQIYE